MRTKSLSLGVPKKKKKKEKKAKMLTFRYQSDNIQQRDTPCSGYLFRKSRERCRLSFCSSLVDTDGLLVEDFRVTVDAEICSVTTRSFNRHMYKYSETLTRELSKRTQFGSVPWPIGSSWGNEGRFNRDLLPVFSAGGPCEQFWH